MTGVFEGHRPHMSQVPIQPHTGDYISMEVEGREEACVAQVSITFGAYCSPELGRFGVVEVKTWGMHWCGHPFPDETMSSVKQPTWGGRGKTSFTIKATSLNREKNLDLSTEQWTKIILEYSLWGLHLGPSKSSTIVLEYGRFYGDNFGTCSLTWTN